MSALAAVAAVTELLQRVSASSSQQHHHTPLLLAGCRLVACGASVWITRHQLGRLVGRSQVWIALTTTTTTKKKSEEYPRPPSQNDGVSYPTEPEPYHHYPGEQQGQSSHDLQSLQPLSTTTPEVVQETTATATHKMTGFTTEDRVAATAWPEATTTVNPQHMARLERSSSSTSHHADVDEEATEVSPTTTADRDGEEQQQQQKKKKLRHGYNDTPELEDDPWERQPPHRTEMTKYKWNGQTIGPTPLRRRSPTSVIVLETAANIVDSRQQHDKNGVQCLDVSMCQDDEEEEESNYNITTNRCVPMSDEKPRQDISRHNGERQSKTVDFTIQQEQTAVISLTSNCCSEPFRCDSSIVSQKDEDEDTFQQKHRSVLASQVFSRHRHRATQRHPATVQFRSPPPTNKRTSLRSYFGTEHRDSGASLYNYYTQQMVVHDPSVIRFDRRMQILPVDGSSRRKLQRTTITKVFASGAYEKEVTERYV